MSKNTIAFALSIVLLFGGYYAYLMSQQTPPQLPQQTQAQTGATPQSPAAESPAAESPAAESLAAEASLLEPASEGQPENEPSEPPFSTLDTPTQLALETLDLDLAINSKGGCVERATLRNYVKDHHTENKFNIFDKLEPCKALGFKLGSLDLRELPAKISKPDAQTLVMEQRSSGLHIKRILSLGADGFEGKFVVEVKNITENPVSQLVEIELGATSSSESAASFFSFNQSEMRKVAYYADNTRHEEILAFEETPSSKVIIMEPNLNLSWAASGGTYFLFALSPNFTESLGIRLERQPFNMQPNRQSPPERTIYEGWLQQNIQLNAGQSKISEYNLYMGPKKLDYLKKAGHKLDEAITYGFFQIIAWPMFKVLKAIESVVGNWGVAIIILTLLIRLLFVPLTAKSYSAGKKMQKLQPKLNELKELYKDDKQKQQQELMSLMSKEGVNPLGGCLPVLPQIPVFFGLNAVLMNTFDLRLAPFAFWIQDLSSKDPYYVSAVIMAVLMYYQQKLTPMPSMDPTQAKMMRYLPIVFALFMITYPSGLVVYIITSTLFSMAQQQFMMRRYKDV